MNERPFDWLESDAPDLRSSLVRQFALHGVSRGLLSDLTIDLLERRFDRFAPLMVEAQSPPFSVQPSLQRWYREHANRRQAEAMKEALRTWLASDRIPVTDRIYPDEKDAARLIALPNRLRVVEALGDWRDSRALPELRSLRARMDSPILRASIRRIEDPAHADPFLANRHGVLELRRPRAELDSLVVTWYDPVTREISTWRADAVGVKRLWSVLGLGSLRSLASPRAPSGPGHRFYGTLYLSYRDGREVALRGDAGSWQLIDNGRLDSGVEIENKILERTVFAELTRAGEFPAGPRFVAESVTMRIERGELHVQGRYRFEGKAARGFLSLVYPFPADSTLGPPHVDQLTLTGSSPTKALPVTVDDTITPWRLGLKPGNEFAYELRVDYRQTLSGRSATYLVRSALDWGQPLREAWFQVVIDSTLGTPYFPYPFREASESGGTRRFVYSEAPFRPEHDLKVSW